MASRRLLLEVGLALAVLSLIGAGIRTVAKAKLEPQQIAGTPLVDFAPKRTPGSELKKVVVSLRKQQTPWPMWGMTAQRTRYAAATKLRPPFKHLWTVHGHAMIELPPALAYEKLYFGTHAGIFYAAGTVNGKTAWKRNLHHCMAASPAVAGDVVYVALMGPAPCHAHQQGYNGGIIALDATTGKSLWMFHTGIVESSPLVADGIIYFASYTSSKASTIWAVSTKTHQPVWSYDVPAKIAGAAALADGTIYIAAYDSNVYALAAQTGAIKWISHAGPRGIMQGFYATPSIAYGRVYIGGIDGRMYAFGAGNGDLLWASWMGGYVYSSAAIYRDTVYVGSFNNGVFHALDAATGASRWTFQADGKILGSPTVLDGLVYFSTTSRTTYALNAATGAQVWTYPDGQYTPIVADRDQVYLVGLGRIYGFSSRKGAVAHTPVKHKDRPAELPS